MCSILRASKKRCNHSDIDSDTDTHYDNKMSLFLYRKTLFMKEKLNKIEQHNLYTLFNKSIYRSNIVGKTNQFKHNSLFINLFRLQYYLSQWSWPKIDTLPLRI